MPTVASFWVLRDAEHPEAAARRYPDMLRILDASCRRLGLEHIVLTDHETAASSQWPTGVEAWATDLPRPLMRAATTAHALYLESDPTTDVLLLGADCVVRRDPTPFYPAEADVCFTYRGPREGMPINTGAEFVRRSALPRAAALFRRIALGCGVRWCDDQRSLCAQLRPLPKHHGIHQRAGLKVGFVPMDPLFNVVPNSPDDGCEQACVVHFKGKSRKQLFFDWAERHGYA